MRSIIPHSRYLFLYLWSNDHCNQAGVYEITVETMSFETGLPEAEIPDLLKSMAAKVKWLPDQDIIWVKNFIKRQSKSPKFLIAAAKCLKKIKDSNLVVEVVEYNLHHHSISIPYQYTIDSVSIPPVSVSVSGTGPVPGKGKRVGKGEGEQIPRSRLEAEETLYEGDSVEVIRRKLEARGLQLADDDLAVISTWCSVKGFKMAVADASALVARMRTEFPDVDILAESKTWAARKLTEPLERESRPSQQIWNFMRLARKYAQERRDREQGKGQRVKANPREAFRGRSW